MINRPRILVADDEINSRRLVRHVMEREDFVVEEARDGHDALEMVAQKDYDLILMDVQMPGITGFDVIRQLREDERTARLPVIFITARHTQSTDVELGLGLGADDYLRKPFDPRELAARVRTKIRQYHLEENLKRRTEELEALVQIGAELNQSLELDALIKVVLQAAAREIPSDNGVLVLHHEDMTLKRWFFLETPAGIDDLEGRVRELAERIRDISPDGWQDRLPASHTFLEACGYQSAIWTTLYHRGRHLGTLGLVHKGFGVYDEDHLRLLKSIARQSTLAIRNAELYEELRDYAENLEDKVEERTAELQAAQERLIHSEKLASLGRLSADIAHEFNNPLQAILNCLDMAIEDLNNDRVVDMEMLEVAEQHVRRVSKITRELLTFAHQDHDEYDEVDLNNLLEETFILTRKLMQNAGVELVNDLNPLPSVLAIADKIRQVFVNLIINAIEAMPRGGRLRIGSRNRDGFVVLFFEDTGIGISPENQARLFEPFFSTKGENGTGLGLSVSYGIIEGHGGGIELESEVGKGTTFYIWLPTDIQIHPTISPNALMGKAADRGVPLR